MQKISRIDSKYIVPKKDQILYLHNDRLSLRHILKQTKDKDLNITYSDISVAQDLHLAKKGEGKIQFSDSQKQHVIDTGDRWLAAAILANYYRIRNQTRNGSFLNEAQVHEDCLVYSHKAFLFTSKIHAWETQLQIESDNELDPIEEEKFSELEAASTFMRSQVPAPPLQTRLILYSDIKCVKMTESSLHFLLMNHKEFTLKFERQEKALKLRRFIVDNAKKVLGLQLDTEVEPFPLYHDPEQFVISVKFFDFFDNKNAQLYLGKEWIWIVQVVSEARIMMMQENVGNLKLFAIHELTKTKATVTLYFETGAETEVELNREDLPHFLMKLSFIEKSLRKPFNEFQISLKNPEQPNKIMGIFDSSLQLKEKRVEKYEIYILNNLLNSIRTRTALQVAEFKQDEEEEGEPEADQVALNQEQLNMEINASLQKQEQWFDVFAHNARSKIDRSANFRFDEKDFQTVIDVVQTLVGHEEMGDIIAERARDDRRNYFELEEEKMPMRPGELEDKNANQIKISREKVEIQVNEVLNTLLVLVPSGKVMKNFNKVVLDPLLDIIDLNNEVLSFQVFRLFERVIRCSEAHFSNEYCNKIIDVLKKKSTSLLPPFKDGRLRVYQENKFYLYGIFSLSLEQFTIERKETEFIKQFIVCENVNLQTHLFEAIHFMFLSDDKGLSRQAHQILLKSFALLHDSSNHVDDFRNLRVIQQRILKETCLVPLIIDRMFEFRKKLKEEGVAPKRPKDTMNKLLRYILYHNEDACKLMKRIFPKPLFKNVDARYNLLHDWRESEWRQFFDLCSQQDFNSATDQWNESCRQELSQKLKQEYTVFIAMLKNPDIEKVLWNYQDFEIKYESLKDKYKVAGFYLKELVQQGPLSLYLSVNVTKPWPIWEKLKIKFLSTYDKGEQKQILKVLIILYKKHFQLLKELISLKFWAKLLNSDDYRHCHFLLLQLVKVSIEVQVEKLAMANLKEFLKAHGLEVLFSLLSKVGEHYFDHGYSLLDRPTVGERSLMARASEIHETQPAEVDDLIEHRKENACYMRSPELIRIAIITIRIIEKMLVMSQRGENSDKIKLIPRPFVFQFCKTKKVFTLLIRLMLLRFDDLFFAILKLLGLETPQSHFETSNQFFMEPDDLQLIKTLGVVEALLLKTLFDKSTSFDSYVALLKLEQRYENFNADLILENYYSTNDYLYIKRTAKEKSLDRSIFLRYLPVCLISHLKKRSGGPLLEKRVNSGLSQDGLYPQFGPEMAVQLLVEESVSNAKLIWNDSTREVLADCLIDRLRAYEQMGHHFFRRNEEAEIVLSDEQVEGTAELNQKVLEVIEYEAISCELQCDEFFLGNWIRNLQYNEEDTTIESSFGEKIFLDRLAELMDQKIKYYQENWHVALSDLTVVLTAFLRARQRFTIEEWPYVRKPLELLQNIIQSKPQKFNEMNSKHRAVIRKAIKLTLQIMEKYQPSYDHFNRNNGYVTLSRVFHSYAQFLRTVVIKPKVKDDDFFQAGFPTAYADYISLSDLCQIPLSMKDVSSLTLLLTTLKNSMRINIATDENLPRNFRSDNHGEKDVILWGTLRGPFRLQFLVDLSLILQSFVAWIQAFDSDLEKIELPGQSDPLRNESEESKQTYTNTSGVGYARGGTAYFTAAGSHKFFSVPTIRENTQRKQAASVNEQTHVNSDQKTKQSLFDLIHQTKQGDVLKSLLDLVAKVLELLELSSRFVFAHPPLIESGVAWVCLKFIFLSLLSSENEFYRNWNLHELVLSATRTFRNIVMVSSLIEDGNQDLSQSQSRNPKSQQYKQWLREESNVEKLVEFHRAVKKLISEPILEILEEQSVVVDFQGKIVEQNEQNNASAWTFLRMFVSDQEVTPVMMWNSRTREELKVVLLRQILKLQRSIPSAEEMKLPAADHRLFSLGGLLSGATTSEINEFKYSELESELIVADILVRHYNKTPMFKPRSLDRFQSELLTYIEKVFQDYNRDLLKLSQAEDGEPMQHFVSAINALLNCFKYHLGLDATRNGKKCVSLICDILESYAKIEFIPEASSNYSPFNNQNDMEQDLSERLSPQKAIEQLGVACVRLLKQMSKRYKHSVLLFHSRQFIKVFVNLLFSRKYRPLIEQTLAVLRNIIITDNKTIEKYLASNKSLEEHVEELPTLKWGLVPILLKIVIEQRSSFSVSIAHLILMKKDGELSRQVRERILSALLPPKFTKILIKEEDPDYFFTTFDTYAENVDLIWNEELREAMIQNISQAAESTFQHVQAKATKYADEAQFLKSLNVVQDINLDNHRARLEEKMTLFGPVNGDIILRIYNREKGVVDVGDPALFLKGIMELLSGFYNDFQSNMNQLRSEVAFKHDVNIVLSSLLYFMKALQEQHDELRRTSTLSKGRFDTPSQELTLRILFAGNFFNKTETWLSFLRLQNTIISCTIYQIFLFLLEIPNTINVIPTDFIFRAFKSALPSIVIDITRVKPLEMELMMLALTKILLQSEAAVPSFLVNLSEDLLRMFPLVKKTVKSFILLNMALAKAVYPKDVAEKIDKIPGCGVKMSKLDVKNRKFQKLGKLTYLYHHGSGKKKKNRRGEDPHEDAKPVDKYLEQIEELNIDGNNALPFVSELATKVQGTYQEYEVRPVAAEDDDIKSVIDTVQPESMVPDEGVSSGDEEDDLEYNVEDPDDLDEAGGSSRNRSGTFLLSGWVQNKMEEEEKEARSQENLQKLGLSPGSGLQHAGTMGLAAGAMIGSAAESAEIKREIENKSSLPFFSESEPGSLTTGQPFVVNVNPEEQIGKVREEEEEQKEKEEADAFEADAFEADAFDGDAFDAEEPKKEEEPKEEEQAKEEEPAKLEKEEEPLIPEVAIQAETNLEVEVQGAEKKEEEERGSYHEDDELKVVLTQDLEKEAEQVVKQEEEKVEEQAEEEKQTEVAVQVEAQAESPEVDENKLQVDLLDSMEPGAVQDQLHGVSQSMKKEIEEEGSTPEEKPLLEAVVDEAKQESQDLLDLGGSGGVQIGAAAEKGAAPLSNEDKPEDPAGGNLLDIGGDVEVKASIDLGGENKSPPSFWG